MTKRIEDVRARLNAQRPAPAPKPHRAPAARRGGKARRASVEARSSSASLRARRVSFWAVWTPRLAGACLVIGCACLVAAGAVATL